MIADVEREAREHADIAAADDDERAGHRGRDADGLHQGEPVAEQHEAPQRHEQRRHRLQQQRVDRLGVVQRQIGDHVVAGRADEREQHDRDEMAADRRPVAPQMRQRERQQHQEGERPAHEGQRRGRHQVDRRAPDDGVAGPEQRGEGEQEIGMIEPAHVGRMASCE